MCSARDETETSSSVISVVRSRCMGRGERHGAVNRSHCPVDLVAALRTFPPLRCGHFSRPVTALWACVGPKPGNGPSRRCVTDLFAEELRTVSRADRTFGASGCGARDLQAAGDRLRGVTDDLPMSCGPISLCYGRNTIRYGPKDAALRTFSRLRNHRLGPTLGLPRNIGP